MGMVRRREISAFLFCCIGAASAHAASNARDTFNALNACAKSHEIDNCREDLTASSVAMFDRFNGYGLADCLPSDVTYVSESKSGQHDIIRAKTTYNGTQRYMRLIFSMEENKWKLDVPASLERSMGPKWEKQVQTIETMYLLLRQQMGGKLDCSTVQALAK